MSDIINQIADAIEAEIHEAWTESDADFNRGMEYAVSIVKAVDIRTDGDLISRQDAIAEFRDGRDVYDIMESIEELPSAEAEQVTGKLKNPCDSLLTADSEACKKQKSKLDLISRQDAIDEIKEIYEWHDNVTKERIIEHFERFPSAEPKTGEWVIHDEVKNIYGGIYIECSECGTKFVTQTLEDEHFCRNCGADMRGEEE